MYIVRREWNPLTSLLHRDRSDSFLTVYSTAKWGREESPDANTRARFDSVSMKCAYGLPTPSCNLYSFLSIVPLLVQNLVQDWRRQRLLICRVWDDIVVPFTLINYNRQSAQQKICFALCCSLFGQRRQDKEVQKTEPSYFQNTRKYYPIKRESYHLCRWWAARGKSISGFDITSIHSGVSVSLRRFRGFFSLSSFVAAPVASSVPSGFVA